MITTNLETYSIVWLDANVNLTDNGTSSLERRQLRSMINHLQVFDDVEKCASYISSVPEDKVVLIVSGSFTRLILSEMHNTVQLCSVYVYCLDLNTHEKLRGEFPKIRGIYSNTSLLISSVTNDCNNLKKLCKNDLPVIFKKSNTMKNASEKSMLTKHNGHFLWFQVVIALVLQLDDEKPREGVKELAARFRDYFAGNYDSLATVNEFEQDYEANFAFFWYTKVTFFYDSLNKALRTFDIHMIVAFRVFIRDLRDLLQNSYVTQRDARITDAETGDLYVYRGQSLSRNLLDQHNDHEGELISFTNFLSTSRNRDTAVFFMDSCQSRSQGLEPVLYEIRIPNQIMPAKPYADIANYSHHPEEQEVLFMIGTILRIDKVLPGDDFTIVRLTLVGKDDYELREIENYLTETKISSNKYNLMVDLANILENIGEYAKAQAFFRRSLEESPEGDIGRAACISGLGGIALRSGDYTKAIDYENQAIELYEKANPYLGKLSRVYNNLGIAYGANQQYNIARKHFEHSNKLKFCLFHDEQHIEMADTFDNIASCYVLEGAFDEAEEYSLAALATRIRNNIPREHDSFVKTYMGLGDVYTKKKLFKPAYTYLQKALDTALDGLPADHPEIGEIYNSFGDHFKANNDPREALQYYRKALDIFENSYDQDHPDRKRTQHNLERIVDSFVEKSKVWSIVFRLSAGFVITLMYYLFRRSRIINLNH